MPAASSFYVYLHKRLDTEEVFYVGKGSGRRAYVRSGRNALWSRIAAKHGFSVEIIHLGLTETQAFSAEESEIAQRSPICNFTFGGDGISGYRHTDATKMVLREANVGRTQPAEVVEKRAAKLRGQTRSPQFCELMSELNRGRSASAETRAKMSASRQGAVRSLDAVAQTAAWHQGKKRSAGARAAMSAAQPKRPVICHCTGTEFPSLVAAAEWLRANGHDKANKTGIWYSASGRREASYGYRWGYA